MQRRPSEPLPGDPNVAVLISWILPGAGHVYLGRAALGIALFVVLEGLYGLGWILSHGRSFEFLDPELRGPFATVLTPELGNLGGLLLQLQRVGFGGTEPRPFPPYVALGGWLCAFSGLGNMLVMVHAHLLARTPRDAPRRGLNPAALVGAAWLVPGLGHLLQGRRLRALIVAVVLLGLFGWGTSLAHGSNLSRERHFYYWSGQALLGLPAFVTELASGHPAVTGPIPRADVGLLYASMAGLLGVLAWLDVYAVAERRWLGLDEAPAAAPAAGETAPAAPAEHGDALAASAGEEEREPTHTGGDAT